MNSEAGITLVETVIAAAILVMVLLAVMATLDTASSSTAANRGRTVASALAEQDQERMRAMRASELSNYHEVQPPVTVGKAEYTVESRSEWIRDSTGGAESCTASSTQADYMRITSTVTSDVIGKRTKPVQIRSLVAPRVGSFGTNQGTLAVSLKDEAGKPLPAVPVNISGPDALQDATNAEGCAVFGHIPTGTYGISVNQLGYVDPSGNQQISQTKTVSPQTVQTVALQYAPAASVTVNVTTKVGSNPEQPSLAKTIAASNANLPSPGVRLFTAAGAGSSTIPAANLFPFTDGYSFYSGGGCANADPSGYEADYFDTFGYAKPGPGEAAVVNVREPALNFQVTRGSGTTGSPYPTAHVVITPTCGPKSTVNPLIQTGTLAATLTDPGFPFGTYTICADDGTRKATVTGVVNDSSAGLPLLGDGTPQRKIHIKTADPGKSPSGTCS